MPIYGFFFYFFFGFTKLVSNQDLLVFFFLLVLKYKWYVVFLAFEISKQTFFAYTVLLEDENQQISEVANAFRWVISYAWKKKIKLQVKYVKMAATDFKTNAVHQEHVEVLKLSICKHGVQKDATAPLHAVCFLSTFFF